MITFFKELFKILICKHEYNMTIFAAPHREVLLLQCANCGYSKFELLAKDKK